MRTVLQLGWRSADFWLGSWHQQRIAIKAFGLIPLILLMIALDQATVTLKHPGLDQARYGGTPDAINQGIYRDLLVIFVIVVLEFIWKIGRPGLDLYRKRSGLMLCPRIPWRSVVSTARSDILACAEKTDLRKGENGYVVPWNGCGHGWHAGGSGGR